ncbi:hypothetical protein CEXT_50441 [Caerostris extrusa]|uniref:Uncharacterized protein n=1 Tax=Caerostris extrusa TaxID=172846 RepID=A0AAV4MVV9_CAEEX|nr:hypothetical protein CEXT_50441 [Caerostris extrusa]
MKPTKVVKIKTKQQSVIANLNTKIKGPSPSLIKTHHHCGVSSPPFRQPPEKGSENISSDATTDSEIKKNQNREYKTGGMRLALHFHCLLFGQKILHVLSTPPPPSLYVSEGGKKINKQVFRMLSDWSKRT